MIKLIVTSDGSHSLMDTTLNETYHSTHGAVQESIHVFIKNGLAFFVSRGHSSKIKILEVGFGTGLNALLALKYAKETGYELDYETYETSPIDLELVQQLNYPGILQFDNGDVNFEKLHTSPWQETIRMLPNFSITKKLGRIQDGKLIAETFDVVFFDAFAPSKQSEMWEPPLLAKVARAMKPGGVFVTYCAKGQLKRDLKELGFTVETLAGPPGKKEMVRGTKPDR